MNINRIVLALAAVAALGFGVLTAGANASDTVPFAGSWTLNLTKSSYPGPALAPKSASRKTEVLADGKLKTSIESVEADGKTVRGEATFVMDGKDYPTSGSTLFDAVAIKKIDANTIEVTRKLAGKVVDTYKIVVSADGKTLTQTTLGATPEAKPTIAVYDKQ